MNLRVNYLLPQSRANGPGLRYTIWVQGCSIHCPGCSNTDTWDPDKGFFIPINELIENILSDPTLDGVTITGGEPLDQYEAVKELCMRLFGKISIFLTTGYTAVQVIQNHMWGIIKVVDLMCVGPFEKDKIVDGEWKGSSNQIIMEVTDLGKKQALMPVIKKEFHINSAGQVLKTGFSQ